MKTKLVTLVLAGLIVLVLTACSGTDNTAMLDGTSWTLNDLSGSIPIAGTTITAKFADGQISGSSGCNTYGGSYEVSGDNLTVSQVFMTEMACLEPVGAMDQELAYFQLLSDAASFQIDGAQLQITIRSGDTLTFVSSGE